VKQSTVTQTALVALTLSGLLDDVFGDYVPRRFGRPMVGKLGTASQQRFPSGIGV
jgi:hypothetical protein